MLMSVPDHARALLDQANLTADEHAGVEQVLDLYDSRELLGFSEMAVFCGRSKMTIQNWRRSYSNPFPAPSYELAAGPAWWVDEVLPWMYLNLVRIPDNAPAWKYLA